MDKENVSQILQAIVAERLRQENLRQLGKFLYTCESARMSDADKLAVLAEEFGEVSREVAEIRQQYLKELTLTPEAIDFVTSQKYLLEKRKMLREELTQLAAVCVSWCECLNIQIGSTEGSSG